MENTSRAERWMKAFQFIKESGGMFHAVVAHYPVRERISSVSLDAACKWLNTDFVREVCADLDRKLLLAQTGVYDFSPADKFALDMMIEHIIYHQG